MSQDPHLTISVIIPTLNERNNLPAAVLSAAGADEIIVVDGGSTDGTREWALAQSHLRIVDATRGRGPQLARGASAAAGAVLLFVHADCRLPPNAMSDVRRTLADARVAGGCFSVRFAESRTLSLGFTAYVINLHSRLTRTATGDQAIFVRSAIYTALGGFPPWPLFEDVQFVDRLRRQGRFAVLPAAVTISARRWQEWGVARTNLLMICLWIGYRFGVPPATLKRWFADVRPAPSSTRG